MEDQRPKTLEHIRQVRNQLDLIINKLHDRARDHDISKLEEPEKSIFDEYTPKLKNTTYGSAEYDLLRSKSRGFLVNFPITTNQNKVGILLFLCLRIKIKYIKGSSSGV